MNLEQSTSSIRFLGQMARRRALEQPATLDATLEGIKLCKTQGVLLDHLRQPTRAPSSPASLQPDLPADQAPPTALSASDHCLAGYHAMQAAAHDAALTHFSMAVAANPEAAEYCFNLGNAWAAKADYVQAICHYDRALAIRPSYAQAHCNRGNALYLQGDLEAALASLDQAIASQPDMGAAHLNRGNVLARLGRYADAMQDYTNAQVCNPDLLEAAYNRSIVLKVMLLENPGVNQAQDGTLCE